MAADNEFQVEAIGEVYAQALVNEAQKQGVLGEITEDVRGIGELLKSNSTFSSFTQNLTIGEEERLEALKKIFGGRVHPLMLQVLESMARRDRLMFLNGFVEAFEEILKKMSGHVDVELVSATELNPGVLDRIRQSLAQKAGGSVDLKVKIDPSLIGGVMVRIGDTLIDGSVATQLEKIEEQLKRRGVSQLQGGVSAVVA
ncbi:MAG: ATP synthase F1 subunit delta [Phycisphaerae bacterium]